MRVTVDFTRKSITEHTYNTTVSDSENEDNLRKQLVYGAIKYSILKCGNEKKLFSIGIAP